MRYKVFILLLLCSLSASAQCDKSIWDHAYKSENLTVLETCATAFGVIVGSIQQEYGDAYGWIKTDNTQEHFIKDTNKIYENGNLVFKVVCYSIKENRDLCQGYANNIVIPPVGSHVKITGVFVQDAAHKFRGEIHPVTRIELIQ